MKNKKSRFYDDGIEIISKYKNTFLDVQLDFF